MQISGTNYCYYYVQWMRGNFLENICIKLFLLAQKIIIEKWKNERLLIKELIIVYFIFLLLIIMDIFFFNQKIVANGKFHTCAS